MLVIKVLRVLLKITAVLLAIYGVSRPYNPTVNIWYMAPFLSWMIWEGVKQQMISHKERLISNEARKLQRNLEFEAIYQEHQEKEEAAAKLIKDVAEIKDRLTNIEELLK
ncbi:MAG: hypothetical protein EOM67_08575 [Spirochaetia bacterium]|nr:hypothetical protein [Spirochaetia bacterium]